MFDPEDFYRDDYSYDDDLERGDEPRPNPSCSMCKTEEALVYYYLPDITLCDKCKAERTRILDTL